MNRVFRIVWSRGLNSWVVASELVARHGCGRGTKASVDDRRGATRRAGTLGAGLLAAAVALYVPGAGATTRYWDVNGGSVGSGGTGTWNTTSTYWNASSDGVAGPFFAWNNAAIDSAVFAGTAGAVSLGAVTANALTFDTSGYSLTGGTLTLAGASPTISVTGTTGTASIGSVVAGSAGLTKAGAGTLTLSGANTFSGGVSVSAGTLALNGASSFTGDVNVASGAVLSVASDAALGAAANRVLTTAGSQLTLSGTALAAGRSVLLGAGGQTTVTGTGASATRYSGAGGLTAYRTSLLNNANDYTGQTILQINPNDTLTFSSVGNLGQASALGAASDPTAGTILVQRINGSSGTVSYTGSGSDSNRNWLMPTTGGNLGFQNNGSGTLTLRGSIVADGSAGVGVAFTANTADLALLGPISGTTGGIGFYGGGSARTVTLGDANTFTGAAGISAATVKANTLANSGAASSLGAGSGVALGNGGVLSYGGAGSSSNRSWTVDGNTSLNNDGTGPLTLSGATSFTAGGVANDTLNLGGSFAGGNTWSGTISGAGTIASNGAGTWQLTGTNTRTGGLTVTGGTLRAGSASAFGTTTAVAVSGGTLDLNNFNLAATSLAGSGGAVALGSGTLTVNPASGNTTFGGSIAGSGGLTKLGAGTQTLTGANTYGGVTRIGGGTLALDFTAGGAPAGDILSAVSVLDMAGGTLAVTGSAGQSQTFAGSHITGGSNTIKGSGNVAIHLGPIDWTAGLINFVLPTTGNITTTAGTSLGGWATVTSGTVTDYAQVDGVGNIVARTSYATKDNAATWLNGDVVSDTAGTANSPYTGTVAGSVQLGGLKYTAAAPSTVTVGTGNTLGVDGTIIVSESVGSNADTITGGQLTGAAAGGTLGILQNGSGNFTVASTIVDAAGGTTSFTKSGAGQVTLSGANSYTGATTVSGGRLSINSVANGGVASAIGASGSASSNLVLQGATLGYTGTSASSDRGFTLATNGAVTADIVDVSLAGTNLAFSGVVASPDNAGLTKTGLGTLTLSNPANTYAGITTIAQGTLAVGTLANGGLNSGIGAASSASSNLVMQNGGELEYTGISSSTNRGFTLGAVVVARSTWHRTPRR